MRQPDETEQMYAAFTTFINAERYIRPRVACEACGVSDTIPARNRWEERADAYWAETSRILGHSISSAINRLNVSAIEAAFTLLQERTVEERHEMQRVTPDGPVTEQGVRTKRIAPDARVVLALLERMLGGSTTDTDTDIAGLLQTMVYATVPSANSSTASGVVEQSGTPQRGIGGAAVVQDGDGQT